MVKIKKGLDIPISGLPDDNISDFKKPRSVALLGSDYHGLKPSMLVSEGEEVKLGQPIFTDKKNPGIFFTSPGGGRVESINRGERRSLQSVVIELDQEEKEIVFPTADINQLTPDTIKGVLIESGLWTCFRTRPFSKIPGLNDLPNSMFINCMDTSPMSLEPENVILENKEFFDQGLQVIKSFINCPIHICIKEKSLLSLEEKENLYIHEFSGPHPAGLVGTHMHFISPTSTKKINWHIDYADIISIGYLFLKKKLLTKKYISLSGPQVENPRIISTRVGACIEEITAGEVIHSNNRLISGSVINGREAIGPYSYLGKYHNQISVIEEPTASDRELFDWGVPGFNRYSKLRIFISSLFKNKKYPIKARMYGPDRAILPIGVYEQVFPLNLLISLLLRQLAIGDTEELQALGILELDEEDLALCSFVCPSKYDFGYLLRERLNSIEIEG